MPNEYIFIITYCNKETGCYRGDSVNIFADCEADAFDNCLNEAYKLIDTNEGLFRIELLCVF